ncbi:MAG: DUF2273 domain-containing protein [Finegoldia sp.]|nr:DUF2273 domain-containing protein [Finegoldia sp.]
MDSKNIIQNENDIVENTNEQTIYHVDQVKMKKLDLREERNAKIKNFVGRNKNRIIALVLAVVTIICLLNFGFFRTLGIWVIMIVAYFIGAYLDRDPKVLNFLIKR